MENHLGKHYVAEKQWKIPPTRWSKITLLLGVATSMLASYDEFLDV